MPQDTQLIATAGKERQWWLTSSGFLHGRPLMFEIDPDGMSVIA
jgi:hypothetical protein